MPPCNCTTPTIVSPSGECLPTVADDCAIARDASICKPRYSDPHCIGSDQSDGTTLATTWSDACCHSEGVTLLGRVGSKLAKLAGDGFIKITNGYASVVSAVPLSLTTLWHHFFKTGPGVRPILGDPLPFNYLAVGDANGNLHGIKGPSDQVTVTVWDYTANEYNQTPLSELPLPRKGVLATGTNLELTGYAPIVESGDIATVRQQKALSGSGLVILTEVVTPDSTCECADGNGTASVASTLALPVPDADEVYVLKYSTALGLHWEEE